MNSIYNLIMLHIIHIIKKYNIKGKVQTLKNTDGKMRIKKT